MFVSPEPVIRKLIYDAPFLRIEDHLLFPLSLLYVRRLIVVLAPDNVFVLLLVVARMVGLGLVPNVTPSLPNQYGVGGWDLKSYVDYCWFSLKRQRLRPETTMLCLSASTSGHSLALGRIDPPYQGTKLI